MKNFIPFLVPVLKAVVHSVSPEAREIVNGAVEKLERKTKATPNPFDDLLVEGLKAFLGL